MTAPKDNDNTEDSNAVSVESTALFAVHPASHMAQRMAGERFYRRKTPREGGTTNCHSCGVEISQSALCPSCWHKRAFGIRFEKRGDDDPHICIQLLGEDDENWFEVGTPFSSYWLDDLINCLTAAKATLEREAEADLSGFGYQFNSEKGQDDPHPPENAP